jgi:hypothetical protein
VPSSEANTFCIRPALTPRRFGEDSTFMIAKQIGRKGPSASPMRMRTNSSAAKEPASPDNDEHSENTIVVTSRKGLRKPLRSDHAPIA